MGMGLLPGAADHWIVMSDFRGVEPEGPVLKTLRAAAMRKKRVLLVPLEPISDALRGRLTGAGAAWVPVAQEARAT